MRHGGGRRRGVRRRRGVGIFFVVFISIVVLAAFIGIFQMTFSRQVTDQVTRGSLGETALTLAESAVTEALYEIRHRVNDPEDPLYRLVRREVYAGQTGEFPITVEPKETQKLLKQESFRRYWLDDCSAKVAFQWQFNRIPYERWGMVTCVASVGTNLSLTDKVVRTVEVGAELRVTLPGPPRPFDQVAFMVLDASSLVRDAGYRVNESVRELDAAETDRREFLEALQVDRGSLSGIDVDAVMAALSAVVIPERRTLLARVHEFIEPITMLSMRDSVDLAAVDLGRLLDEATNAVNRATEVYRRARSRMERNLGSEEANEAYRTALEGLVRAHRSRIDTVATFQDSFTEYSGASRVDLARFFPKLDLASWRRKAAFVIREEPGADVNARLDALKRRMVPLNGVIFVDNPNQPLDLEAERGTFQGRVVVVATGSVRVGSGTTAMGPTDLLTVVAFGTLSVDGDCHCALVANDRVTVRESTTVTGNLVIREIRDASGLQGTVVRDDRLYSGRTVPGDTSGAFMDYYYAAVGPGEVYRAITRR